jgi:hypothetical protein
MKMNKLNKTKISSIEARDSNDRVQKHINQIAIHGNAIYSSIGPIRQSIRLNFAVNPNNS